MERIHKVEGDLNYVRSVLDQADQVGAPSSIYWLWAVISLVGFSLYDLKPEWIPIFWPIAGPLGGVLSFAMGWRWGRRLGQGSIRIAKYHALHWFAVMMAIFLLVPLKVRGLIDDNAFAHLLLVVMALGWFTAGIYLVRDYKWIGLVLAAGYVALLLIEGFNWIGVGILVAVSLVWAALRGGRSGAQGE